MQKELVIFAQQVVAVSIVCLKVHFSLGGGSAKRISPASVLEEKDPAYWSCYWSV